MKKKMFVVVYSDSSEAYIFNSFKEAKKQAKDDLRKESEVGTTARIYDLTKLDCVQVEIAVIEGVKPYRK